MPPTNVRRSSRFRSRPRPFALYVEGPSDRDILTIWARRLSPRLARAMGSCAVILGGRQPARAVAHFRRLQDAEEEARGLCVLDRDHHHEEPGAYANESGLEFYTWRRRHIESYLLVPRAIGRCAGLDAHDPRLGRAFREHLESWDDEEALRRIDAKQLLSPTGVLSRALGRPLSVGRVARALREEELHGDVLALFERLSRGLGMRGAGA